MTDINARGMAVNAKKYAAQMVTPNPNVTTDTYNTTMIKRIQSDAQTLLKLYTGASSTGSIIKYLKNGDIVGEVLNNGGLKTGEISTVSNSSGGKITLATTSTSTRVERSDGNDYPAFQVKLASNCDANILELFYDNVKQFFCDKVGTIHAQGYNSADGSAGISGTFTSQDGKTVTVKNGLITSIA